MDEEPDDLTMAAVCIVMFCVVAVALKVLLWLNQH